MRKITGAAIVVAVAVGGLFIAPAAFAEDTAPPVTEVTTGEAPADITADPVPTEPAPEPVVAPDPVPEAVTAPATDTAKVKPAPVRVEWVVPVGIVPSPLDKVTVPQGASVGSDGFPQWILGHENAPTCDAWVQGDDYPSQKIADRLTADGVLTYGEDHGLASGWTFRYLGDCPPPAPPAPESESDQVVVFGEWTAPTFDCDTQVGDEQTIIRDVTTTPRTRTTGEPTFNPDTDTWTQGPWSEWVDGTPIVSVESALYAATTEDVLGVDCPVATPEPIAQPTEAAPAASARILAETGGNDNVVIGGLASAAALFAVACILFTIAARRRYRPTLRAAAPDESTTE